MVNRQGWVVVIAVGRIAHRRPVARAARAVPPRHRRACSWSRWRSSSWPERDPAWPSSVSCILRGVHAGTPSRVELSVRNAGSRRTGVLRLHDPVTDTAGAELLLGPSRAGQGARGRLPAADGSPRHRASGPTASRGQRPVRLGRAVPGCRRRELTVLPRIDELTPMPHSVGRDDPHAGADHPNVLGQGGEDFYTCAST